MPLKRFVYVVTSSAFKVREISKAFSRYGVNVIQWNAEKKDMESMTEYELTSLLAGELVDRKSLGITNADKVSIVGVIKEKTKLLKYDTNEDACLDVDKERVQHVSMMKAVRMNKKTKELIEKDYEYKTEGFIDLTRKKTDATEVYGWDELFCVKGGDYSYQDLADRNLKISSRDMNVSRFIRDKLYYKKKTSLKFTQLPQERSIDFGLSVREFVERNEHLNNPTAVKYKIPNMYRAMCNNGAFFRSAKNRREKTYWLPGLNAGIPFTPKKDAIHEITFMTHDFGHFTVPDLVFDGTVSHEHTNVYIAWRMMSEAVTMVMADMIFVHSLTLEYPSYDYSKRKIFPLLEDTGIDLTNPDTFKENVMTLLKANVAYCLMGDDSKYKELLNANGVSDVSNLERFKRKYMPFFVEDFRWTVKNFDNMCSNAKDYDAWWSMVEPVRTQFGVKLDTISEIIDQNDAIASNALQRDELVWAIFDKVSTTHLEPGWLSDTEVKMLEPNQQLAKAFARWFIGQAAIFSKYSFLPESKIYFEEMKEVLMDSTDSIELKQIYALRTFFEQYLSILRNKSLISVDDELTFRTFYPLFEPFYVFYDAELDAYTDLDVLSTEIFKRATAPGVDDMEVCTLQDLPPRSCYAAETEEVAASENDAMSEDELDAAHMEA